MKNYVSFNWILARLVCNFTACSCQLLQNFRHYESFSLFTKIGHTIVGDYTYSLRQDGDTHRMMLHAYRLSLPLKPCIDHLDIQAPDPFTSDELWESEQVHSSIEDIPDLV